MISDYFCVQLHQSANVLFPLESTQEVISLTYGEVCPVPGVSSALIGVVNQRGKLLWVLELSDLLQLSETQYTRRSQDNLTLLVLKSRKESGQQVGCVVSALKGIISLDLALHTNSKLTPNWSKLKSNSITFAGEDYAAIDVQTILNNIHDLYNNLVTNV